MAYINAETAKAKREALKLVFPSKEGWKFSVTIHNYSTISVAIMEAQISFEENLNGKTYKDVNHYYLHAEPNNEILTKIYEIVNAGNHNRSDAMSDYFDVGFDVDFSIGKYDKPFVFNKK